MRRFCWEVFHTVSEALQRLHDEDMRNHQRLVELEEPTEQELSERRRQARVRNELMGEIRRGARLDAEVEIFHQAGLQDVHDSVMESTAVRVAVGTSQYNRVTSPLVRRHDRQRAWGRATREQIDRMLDSGDYTVEQRRMLRYHREKALEDELSAQRWLDRNKLIRRTGYGAELFSSLLPASWAGRAIGAPARAAGSNTARRAAGEAASTVGEQNASRIMQTLRADLGQGAANTADRAARAVAGDALVDGTVTVARTKVGDVRGIVRQALRRGESGTPAPTVAAPGVVRLSPEQTRQALDEAITVAPRSPAAAAPPSLYRSPEARTGTVVDDAPLRDPAARTERIRRVDEMTHAERQAWNDRMAASAVDRGWRQGRGKLPAIGDDVLPSPPGVPTKMSQPPFTASEVQRLFEPGRNLTGPEIVRKSELLILRERARNLAEGMRGAERTALQDWYRQVDSLAHGDIPTVITRHTPYQRTGHGGAPLPRDFAEMASVLDAPPPFMRPSVERGRTLEMTLPDYPPLIDSAVHQGGSRPLLPTPLRPDARSARPTVQWPPELAIQGRPGPGVHRRHLETAQQIANQTGEPLVIAGTRQTGVRADSSHPVGGDPAIRFGVVGAGPVERTVRHTVKGIVTHAASNATIETFESVRDALDRGHLVVTPQPSNP